MENGKQMRITPAEIALIKATFKGNEDLLKLIRKIFLPEYDPQAPLGQVIDLWMSLNLKELSTQDAQIKIEARNSLILHVEQQLLALRAIADGVQKTPDELAAERKKNSTK